MLAPRAAPQRAEVLKRDQLGKGFAVAGALLGVPTPFARWHPLSDVVAVHGIHRQREWDGVTTARVPDLRGNGVTFVVLPDGSILEEEGEHGDVTPLAEVAERVVSPPYRAVAVRREEGVWAVGVLRLDVRRLPGVDGDGFELASHDGVRTLKLDERPQLAEPPAVAALAAGLDNVVVRGERLEDDLWEVEIAPL